MTVLLLLVFYYRVIDNGFFLFTVISVGWAGELSGVLFYYCHRSHGIVIQTILGWKGYAKI